MISPIHGLLSFAAAPTFATMALLTGIHDGGGAGVLCSALQGGWPLNGMVSMYLLMAAFHVGPWVKLLSSRRRADAR